MPSKVRVTGPEVIAFAEQHSIDLSTVTASSGDGRVSKSDAFRAALTDRLGLPRAASNDQITGAVAHVQFLAKQRADREAERAADPLNDPALRAAVDASNAAGAHALRAEAARRGPAYALNPMVDRVRASATANAPAPAAPPPTLFASGDLPVFTASGIPPETLLQVPTCARHALAAAASSGDAYKILQDCTVGIEHEGDGEAIASAYYSNHPGNADYASRVVAWQQAAITDDQLEAEFESRFPGLLGPPV